MHHTRRSQGELVSQSTQRSRVPAKRVSCDRAMQHVGTACELEHARHARLVHRLDDVRGLPLNAAFTLLSVPAVLTGSADSHCHSETVTQKRICNSMRTRTRSGAPPSFSHNLAPIISIKAYTSLRVLTSVVSVGLVLPCHHFALNTLHRFTGIRTSLQSMKRPCIAFPGRVLVLKSAT
eukprot:6202671-Pleurochrysis_carterae.AAC.1